MPLPIKTIALAAAAILIEGNKRSELSIDTANAKGRSKQPTFELQHKDRKQLERFRPEPAECCCCEQRVNHAIEKMLERDHPASAAPNRFLGVSCAVS